MRLLITGGGTGGHVYPLLAVLAGLASEQAVDYKTDVIFIGRGGSIEERLAGQAGIPFTPLRVGGLRTMAPWILGRNLLLMRDAVKRSGQIVAECQPRAVLATGGYVSAPVIYAAAQRNVPVVIYLPDLEPGWAIKVMARYARSVAVSFKEVAGYFPKGKAVVTGYPVRREFQGIERSGARRALGLDGGQPVVTVFGGSQGAHSINQAVYDHLGELLDLAQIVHISGKQDVTWMGQARAALSDRRSGRYHLFDYMYDEMPQALAAADLVVARAGAATLGELPAVGAASILVPYPFAGRHQERNAEFLVSHGAAVKLDDAALDKELVPTVKRLLSDEKSLKAMSAAARTLFVPDAARNISRLLQ